MGWKELGKKEVNKMGLFNFKPRPSMRPKDVYEVNVPKDYNIKKSGEGKFTIEPKEGPVQQSQSQDSY